ncbi:MAG TPA: MoxR family ATPase [Planctomycetota bacterium]|nr:MoxR family ATPase [Planctomycetota bacterium]
MPATVDVGYLKEARGKIIQELKRIIIGHDTAIDQLLTAFFAGGHCLITGVPGAAKTLMITSLAPIMKLDFKRIQFTPDLMPADITGTEILEEDRTTGHRELKFVRGPLFANIVMADEINRTPPKTQAALLEAMQEKQITMSGQTYPLPKPFFVLATQIPFEQEGTYPLPEAQQDRFMFNIMMPYNTEDEEVTIVQNATGAKQIELKPVISGEELFAAQSVIRDVQVPSNLAGYIVDLVAATRAGEPTAADFAKEYIAWGAGLRASQNIVLAAKSKAALRGATTVTLDDIKAVIVPVLRHRIGLNFRAEVDKVTVESLIDRLVKHVPAPK